MAEARSVVVVVEENAEWPGWLAVCNPLPSGSLVLVQAEGETLRDLASRVAERCRNRGRFQLGVIACSERCDEAAGRFRAMLARAMVREDGGLFFTAGARSSGRCRHVLSALATDLNSDAAREGRRVGVRFGAVPHSAA